MVTSLFQESKSQDILHFEWLLYEIDQLLELADIQNIEEAHFVECKITRKSYVIHSICILMMTISGLGFAHEHPVETDLPATSYVINRMNYSLAYDPKTRNPIYAYEKLSSSCLVGRVSRDNCQFKEDRLIPEIFRATLKDYQGSSFDASI